MQHSPGEMSGAGHWDHNLPISYGAPTTYVLAAEWLAPCPLVEDWGAGTGRFATYRAGRTVGIDGSPGRQEAGRQVGRQVVEVVVPLEQYRSTVAGIHMRHVLEHNECWRTILTNACVSFTDRMVLTLFTPLAEQDTQLAWVEGYEVPDLSLDARALYSILDEHDIEYETERVEDTNAGYGNETMIRMSK